MNISAGLYRLAQVIKWGGRVLGGLWLIGLLMNSDKAGASLSFGLAITFIVITAVVAWVLEGFAND